MTKRDEPTRLWGGRFGEEPAEALMAFTESLSFDRALVHDDAAVLAAHVRALAAAGYLETAEAEAVESVLPEIADDIASGRFVAQPSDEDVHTAIERALIERLPAIGPRARAGLSRNDRVAAAFRLWSVRAARGIAADVCRLVETFARRATENHDVVMPGYTHLQRAQPVRLAHHLLAHAAALLRDAARLCDAADRANVSPLGAGALAGSTLGLDAAAAAQDLGFTEPMANSIDAVAARDFAVEILAACAILGVHCSRIGEELVLWTSSEFGFVELDDAYATGSSLMPQKKNPDVAELARGKAGRLIGDLTGLLVTLKGLPLAYNRDLQEDKEPVFDAVRHLSLLLRALDGAITTLSFRREVMERAAAGGTLLATDLAEYLVVRGVAFRDAHDVVGRIVQRALAQGKDLAGLTIEELRSFSDAIGPDVYDVLSAKASVDRRHAPGPSASSIEAQLDLVATTVDGIRRRCGV